LIDHLLLNQAITRNSDNP